MPDELNATAPGALGFRDVVRLNHRSKTADGRDRLVTLVEFWKEEMRLRWVEAPAPPGELGDVTRAATLRVLTMDDNLGTAYRSGFRSGGGSSRKLEGEVWFQPLPPPGVEEVRVTFPDGDQLTVPIPTGLRERNQ